MYKPAFVHAYKSSKSSLPINVWATAIGRRLPQFRNETDIYSPVPLHVKIAGDLNDSTGIVRLSVMPTDTHWYKKLTDALSEMTGRHNVDVVSYLGKPIRDMNPEQLMAVGECDVIDKHSGAPVRLASIVPPPLHLSTNKQADLKEWWNNQRSALAKTIATQLKDMTMAEIAQATLANGPIQQTIETYLKRHTPHNLEWNKFLEAYGNSGATDAQAMSNKLLDAVRQSLVANETQIRTHHASVGSEASLWKDKKAVTSRYKDDFTLYRDIIEDAMYHPLVGQEMVHAVLYGTQTIEACHKKKKKKKPAKKDQMNMEHPINAYYKEYHYKVHGKLPGHRIAELNVGEQAIGAYGGSAQRAVDMFNLFSGRAVKQAPAPAAASVVSMGEAIEYATKYSMPRLVPIETEELIPIECDACAPRELPKLIPIDQSMPPLIPIKGLSHFDHQPAPVHVPSLEELCEPIWVDDCPNLADFLKK